MLRTMVAQWRCNGTLLLGRLFGRCSTISGDNMLTHARQQRVLWQVPAGVIKTLARWPLYGARDEADGKQSSALTETTRWLDVRCLSRLDQCTMLQHAGTWSTALESAAEARTRQRRASLYLPLASSFLQPNAPPNLPGMDRASSTQHDSANAPWVWEQLLSR